MDQDFWQDQGSIPLPHEYVVGAEYRPLGLASGTGGTALTVGIVVVLGALIMVFSFRLMNDTLPPEWNDMLQPMILLGFVGYVIWLLWSSYTGLHETGVDDERLAELTAPLETMFPGNVNVVIALFNEGMSVRAANRESEIYVNGLSIPIDPVSSDYTPRVLKVGISVWSGDGASARQMMGIKTEIYPKTPAGWIGLRALIDRLEDVFYRKGIEPEYWVCSVNPHLKILSSVSKVRTFGGSSVSTRVKELLERKVKSYYRG